MPQQGGPPIDAQTGAKLAAVVLQKTGVMPDMDSVMDAVGFGSNKGPDFEKYFNAIMAKLDAIKRQLDEVEAAVRDIRQKQTEIQISLSDAKLQEVLSLYERDVNVLNQNYTTWHSGLKGLRSNSPSDRQDGARLLYGIYSVENMGFIEQAMLNVATYLIGHDLFKGILGYLPDVLYADAIQGGSDQSARTFVTICDRSAPDSFHVLRQFGERYQGTTSRSIVPLFRAALLALHKGITLLEMRYRKTIQQDQLRQHYRNVFVICTSINNYWGRITNSDALTQAMSKAVGDTGLSKIPSNFHEVPWTNDEYIHPTPSQDGGVGNYPFPTAFEGLVMAKPFPNTVPAAWPFTKAAFLLPPDATVAKSVPAVLVYEATDVTHTTWIGYRQKRPDGYLLNVTVPAAWEFFGPTMPPEEQTTLCTSLNDTGLLTEPTAAAAATA
jgi:hypothetical protein